MNERIRAMYYVCTKCETPCNPVPIAESLPAKATWESQCCRAPVRIVTLKDY